MYALNLAQDGRCLSATTVNFAQVGATFVQSLPDGNLYDYRYVDGKYVYDPLPKPEPVGTVEIPVAELAELQDKAAAYDILTEGAYV